MEDNIKLGNREGPEGSNQSPNSNMPQKTTKTRNFDIKNKRKSAPGEGFEPSGPCGHKLFVILFQACALPG